MHLTEAHLGAARRLYHDVVHATIRPREALENAIHLMRASPPAATLLHHWLVARLESEQVETTEGILTDDEFEDRPRRRNRQPIACRILPGTSSIRPAHAAG